MNIYDTYNLVKLVEVMTPARSFLRDTFFKARNSYTQRFVPVDLIKNKRTLAPFVSQAQSSVYKPRQGYETKTYEPLLVSQHTIITGDDIIRRSAGEPITGNLSPLSRMANILARDMLLLDQDIARREELMCAEALQTGKITMKGDGVDEALDYNQTNLEVLSGTSLWSDPASDPIEYLRGKRREISQKSGLTPDICVMGYEVVDAFLANPKVQKQLDIKRFQVGEVAIANLDEGVTFIGNFGGLQVYSYDEWYLDPVTKLEKPMLASNKIIMGSTKARTEVAYGLVIDVANQEQIVSPRSPKSWIQESPSARFLQLSSKPLPIINEIDAFGCYTVL